MGLRERECQVTPEALDALVTRYVTTSGIRDLEQAAEHMAANALYQIEVDHVTSVTYDLEMLKRLFV